MSEKQMIADELSKLIEIREEIFEYLDANIPKKSENGDAFDFSSQPKLDAQEVYERFFKLDYQARKLRGFLVKAYELKP